MSRASKPARAKYNSDLRKSCHASPLQALCKHLSSKSLLVSWLGASSVSELWKQQLTTSISRPLFHQCQRDRHTVRHCGMIKCKWRFLTISICPARKRCPANRPRPAVASGQPGPVLMAHQFISCVERGSTFYNLTTWTATRAEK